MKISCKTAKAQGLTRYFTGNPCKHGHVAERRVSDRGCVVCAHERATTWAKQNPERRKEIVGAWYADNRYREALRARQWRKDNPNTYAQAVQNWRKANAGYYRGYMAACATKRRAAKIQRTPLWADQERINAHYNVCAFFNEVNGYTKYHVDHIIPLQGRLVSGLHVPENLQVLLAETNRTKNNRFEVA